MKFKPVLDDTQLKRLSEHKYSCTSSSILEPFLQPWWNWVVQCLPLWLAPNLITITGLFVNILTSLVLVYYNPDGKEEVQLDYMIYYNFESTFIMIEDHLNFKGRYGIAK
jgi:hypothetical protein